MEVLSAIRTWVLDGGISSPICDARDHVESAIALSATMSVM